MECERIGEQLDEYVDDTLAPAARSRVEAHLDVCPACAGLAADLRRLREAARALRPVAPPDRVWGAIAERLRPAPAVPIVQPPFLQTRHGLAPWIGLAAALVLVAGALVIGIQRDWRAAPAEVTATGGNVATEDAVKTITEELLLADQLYSSAIERLEALPDVDAGGVNSPIAENFRLNQEVLDRAIGESRAALEQDPTSRAARESLFQALRQKLGLLQDTIALVNALRASPEAAAPAPSPGKSS